MAVDRNPAAVKIRQGTQGVYSGGFARSVWAKKGKQLAFLDIKADAPDRLKVAAALAEILNLNHFFQHK
jgi:hypothetical protein